MGSRKGSGLENVPPILKRPVWKDSFFWVTIATIAFWVLVFWWWFGS